MKSGELHKAIYFINTANAHTTHFFFFPELHSHLLLGTIGEGFSQRIHYFTNNPLDIDETLASNIASSGITDSVFSAIKKYEDHPSIKKKHFMSGKDPQFSFNF